MELKDNPEISKAFFRAVKTQKRDLDFEKLISNDAFLSYAYAKRVLKTRWLNAEPAILKSAECAYYYAQDVIQARWQEAEPIIATSPQSACFYAQNVLQRRWNGNEPDGEATIMKRPKWALQYAKLVVKGRWKICEKYLYKTQKHNAHYAGFVLGWKIKYKTYYIAAMQKIYMYIPQYATHLLEDADILSAYNLSVLKKKTYDAAVEHARICMAKSAAKKAATAPADDASSSGAIQRVVLRAELASQGGGAVASAGAVAGRLVETIS